MLEHVIIMDILIDRLREVARAIHKAEEASEEPLSNSVVEEIASTAFVGSMKMREEHLSQIHAWTVMTLKLSQFISEKTVKGEVEYGSTEG